MTTNNTDGAALLPVTPELLPCPFCAQPLFVRRGVNPYGRCETTDCWASERKVQVPLDDPRQVAQWNTRSQSHSLPGDVGTDADAQRNIVRTVIDCYNTARPAGLSPVEYVHSKRLVRDAFAALSSVPAQIEQDELLDLIDDTISDSFDEEWNSRMGARHIVGALEHEGWAVVPLAALSSPLPATQEDAERSGVGRLLTAAIGLRDDLLSRAEWDDDAKVVCAGAGAWFRFSEAIDRALSTPQRQEYDGEAVREALREAARAVLADADRPGSRMLLGDDKTPDSWIKYREVGQVELDALSAALAHPAQATHSATVSDATKRMEQTLGATFQATPSAVSGDAGEGE